MHEFYFNECLPPLLSGRITQTIFENSIKAFSKLLNDNSLIVEKGVILNKSPNEIDIHGTLISDHIKNISDRELRTKAYGYFSKYPIDTSCTLDESAIDEIIVKDHKYLGLDATNLAIAEKQQWFLYTLPVNDCLEVDRLVFTSDENPVEIDNWHVLESSSDYISERVATLNLNIEDNLGKLKFLFDFCHWSHSFEKNFRSAHPEAQRLLIEKFTEAKNNQMLFPVQSDDNLIKRCTGKYIENTYELRFGAYGGVRVYFTTKDNVVYIGGMGTKSNSEGEEQSADIRRASNEIRKIQLKLGI